MSVIKFEELTVEYIHNVLSDLHLRLKSMMTKTFILLDHKLIFRAGFNFHMKAFI